jgi:hypothetical protein
VTYYRIVQPLNHNVVTRLGRTTRKAILFSIELPTIDRNSMDYSTSLQLFLPNNSRQSIVDQPVLIEASSSITVDFLPLITKNDSGRSMHVLIRHLCSSYIEMKAIVYENHVNQVMQSSVIDSERFFLFIVHLFQCSFCLFSFLYP